MTIEIVPLGGVGEFGKNVLWLRSGGASILVDAGVSFPDESFPGVDRIAPDFAALRGEKIEGVFLTHGHEDHVGGAAWLHAERGIVPRVPAAGLETVRDGFAVPAYRRFTWGRPSGTPAEPLGSELEVRGLRFRVVPTPGHSPDHVCLFEPERGWLFTGDLFLAERLRYLRADEEVGTLISSLRDAARLEARYQKWRKMGNVGIAE